MITVSITDDHKMVATSISRMLEGVGHIKVLDSFYNGTTLLQGLKKRQPDVLLLDLQLPDSSGEELAPQILKSWPAIRILVLTGMDTTFFVRNMMQLGAMGYVLKNTDEDILVTAIDSVYRGDQFVDPALKDDLFREMLQRKAGPSSIPALTPREKEVLKLITSEYTNQEIANELYLSLRTVENYRMNLLQKMGVKNTAGLVKMAMRMGYGR
jgi:DNA-binding NarL/FixJ family response regulator